MGAALFDAWMTLIEPTVPDVEYHEARVRALLEASGVSVGGRLQEAMRVYREVRRRLDDLRRSTLREASAEEEISEFLRGLGIEAEVGEAHLEAYAYPFVRLTRLREGAAEALEVIRSLGLRGAVVANSRSGEMVSRKLEEEGVLDLLDGVVASGEVGYAKPHPEIFRRALELTESEPWESVMIGDDPEADVAGAKAVGMMAVHVPAKGEGDPRADAVVERLSDLPSILNRLLR